MLELFSIEPRALCFVLSAQPHELNAMQTAIRRALEEGNSSEELEAIRKHACLEDSFGDYSVSSSGRVRRI